MITHRSERTRGEVVLSAMFTLTALFHGVLWAIDPSRLDTGCLGFASACLAVFMAIRHRTRDLDHGIHDSLVYYIALLSLPIMAANMALFFDITHPRLPYLQVRSAGAIVHILSVAGLLVDLVRDRWGTYRGLTERSASDILLEAAMKHDPPKE